VYTRFCGFVEYRHEFFVKERYKFTADIGTPCTRRTFEVINHELYCYTHEWQHPPDHTIRGKSEWGGELIIDRFEEIEGKKNVPGFKMTGPIKVEYF
jgi:hypothetical protein